MWCKAANEEFSEIWLDSSSFFQGVTILMSDEFSFGRFFGFLSVSCGFNEFHFRIVLYSFPLEFILVVFVAISRIREKHNLLMLFIYWESLIIG